jgi:uncharacterized membrane protein YraQ (UPF0718 family)
LSLLLEIVLQTWLVLCDMAPWLLVGFAVAGLLSVFVPAEWTERHFGGRGLRPVLKGTLWGIPMPLCSCSVIPVVASMRRHGASRAAAVAFLLSSPQTGVDCIAITYALLGPLFAVFCPIAALLSGILGGLLVLVTGSNGSRKNGDSAPPKCTDECCTGDGSQSALRRAVRYGFVTLPRDLAVSLLVGVLIAGALAAVVPEKAWEMYLGGGLLSILAMMALGVPIYVCATASVPIAAGLIHLGASPGAAMAFLIAGPASNAATLTLVWKVLGRRTAIIFLVTVAVSAVAFGLALDAVAPLVEPWLPQAVAHHREAEHFGLVPSLWAVILLAVLAFSRSHAPRWDGMLGRSASVVPEHASEVHDAEAAPSHAEHGSGQAGSCCCHRPEPGLH